MGADLRLPDYFSIDRVRRFDPESSRRQLMTQLPAQP
jgi:hypothetical protein